MDIAIIGAGNMGGAIAAAMAKADRYNVKVSNPSTAKLDRLREAYPGISTYIDNAECAAGADVVILAVKPWKLQGVIDEILTQFDPGSQSIVSIAGGVSLDDIDQMLGDKASGPVYHVIPDTAISVGAGMTFIAGRRDENTSAAHTGRMPVLRDQIAEMFETMGTAAVIEERLMGAATALSSCGIAYAYKYVQACVQAGVQMGFYPRQALEYTIATVEGAMAMLRANGTLPQQEIDRVTTPGGMTIKGINALEKSGFTAAVIDAILKPLQK